MAEIASAYVSLIPSARGFGTATSAQINPQMRKTGATSGALLGKSMLKAFIAIGVATKIAQFLGDSVAEAREANKVAALTNNVIKTTGGVAKVSAIQVNRLADALSRKTGIDDEQIATSENLLLTFKNIKREGTGLENIFNRATRASVDLSASGFGSMESTAKMLGKALNDPIKGLTALGRAGVTFTQQQQDQIKALVASGNALKAQKIILREVESQVGGAAAAQATNADKARVALGNLKELIGKSLVPALDAMAGVFANKIAPALTSFITNLQTGNGSAGRFAAFIRGNVVPALREYYTYVFTKVVPAVRDGLVPWITKGKKAFNDIRDAVRQNKPELTQLWNALKRLVVLYETKVLPLQLKLAANVLPAVVVALKMVISAAAFWVTAFNKARGAVEDFKAGVNRMVQAVKGKFQAVAIAAGITRGSVVAAFGAITSAIQGAISKLETLISLLAKARGKGAGTKAGSNLPKTAGREAGKAVIAGLESQRRAIGDAVEKVGDHIGKKLKEKMAKVRDQLATVRDDFAALVEPIASNFTQGLFDFDTAGAFTANLTTVKGTLTTLLGNFKTLIGEGLSPAFLYQLFQSGGPALINSLAGLDKDSALAAGGLFSDVMNLSDQLGTAVAGATDKGAGLEGQTVRLEKKLDKLINAVHHSADRTGDVVNGAASAGHKRGKHGGRRAA